jgi:hypothetical protein
MTGLFAKVEVDGQLVDVPVEDLDAEELRELFGRGSYHVDRLALHAAVTRLERRASELDQLVKFRHPLDIETCNRLLKMMRQSLTLFWLVGLVILAHLIKLLFFMGN